MLLLLLLLIPRCECDFDFEFFYECLLLDQYFRLLALMIKMSVLKIGQGSITLGVDVSPSKGLILQFPIKEVDVACPMMKLKQKKISKQKIGRGCPYFCGSIFVCSLSSIDDTCQRLESSLPEVALARGCSWWSMSSSMVVDVVVDVVVEN